jgi:hypothetical protein
MALAVQSQNPSRCKPFWLAQLLGWLIIVHGGAFSLLVAFALALGLL